MPNQDVMLCQDTVGFRAMGLGQTKLNWPFARRAQCQMHRYLSLLWHCSSAIGTVLLLRTA